MRCSTEYLNYFLQAQQLSELESVFAFGEKFSFNEKQIDLNQFYGGQDDKVEKEVVKKEEGRERGEGREKGEVGQQLTSKAGINGWFDSFDFGERDLFNSRNKPQSPSYKDVTQPKLKTATYDKEVQNQARKRVFANVRRSYQALLEKNTDVFCPEIVF